MVDQSKRLRNTIDQIRSDFKKCVIRQANEKSWVTNFQKEKVGQSINFDLVVLGPAAFGAKVATITVQVTAEPPLFETNVMRNFLQIVRDRPNSEVISSGIPSMSQQSTAVIIAVRGQRVELVPLRERSFLLNVALLNCACLTSRFGLTNREDLYHMKLDEWDALLDNHFNGEDRSCRCYFGVSPRYGEAIMFVNQHSAFKVMVQLIGGLDEWRPMPFDESKSISHLEQMTSFCLGVPSANICLCRHPGGEPLNSNKSLASLMSTSEREKQHIKLILKLVGICNRGIIRILTMRTTALENKGWNQTFEGFEGMCSVFLDEEDNLRPHNWVLTECDLKRQGQTATILSLVQAPAELTKVFTEDSLLKALTDRNQGRPPLSQLQVLTVLRWLTLRALELKNSPANDSRVGPTDGALVPDYRASDEAISLEKGKEQRKPEILELKRQLRELGNRPPARRAELIRDLKQYCQSLLLRGRQGRAKAKNRKKGWFQGLFSHPKTVCSMFEELRSQAPGALEQVQAALDELDSKNALFLDKDRAWVTARDKISQKLEKLNKPEIAVSTKVLQSIS